MSAIQIFRTLPLFEGIADADLEALAARCEERRFRAGEAIFAQGDAGDSMYVVAEGSVNVYLPGEGSRRLSLNDLGPGEHFGELSLFDQKPRSASALASTDIVLYELRRGTLVEHLAKRPETAMALLRTVSGHLRSADARLSAHAAKDVDAELDKSLTWAARLADRVASLNGSWSFILLLLGLSLTWAVTNELLGEHAFDRYPYEAYNLFLALLVSLQGPLIMMSQNRENTKDRARAVNDYQVNLKNEVNIETLLRELGELRSEVDQRLSSLEAR